MAKTQIPKFMDTVDSGVHAYDRQTLIRYRNHAITNLHDDVLKKICDLGLLRRPGLQTSASPDAGGWERGRRKRCSRKRKRGKRAGVRARLKINPSRPALPSIILSNVYSLDNKLDYIQQTRWREYRECCVFVFTETWLSDRVLDAAIQLDGLTVFRDDRNAALCVSCYIGKCIDDVTVSKTITTRSNQKPWMTAEVRALLQLRDSAFRAGVKEALRTARAKLSRAIKEVKRTHTQRIHGHFQDSRDSRRMWQGIQAITNYKTTPSACDSDASLPDALNDFYARFEAQNTTTFHGRREENSMQS
ncbi:hypothetical protein QTP86_007114 [Hemibagrus guttatus]|nr:hypothetical protein QTP86_007114 [Hemibagrus guttatus]